MGTGESRAASSPDAPCSSSAAIPARVNGVQVAEALSSKEESTGRLPSKEGSTLNRFKEESTEKGFKGLCLSFEF